MSRDDLHPGTDLRLVFHPDGGVDLDLMRGEPQLVEGLDNLGQALALRLLTAEGELRELGHPRYGSRVRELCGESLDRPNLELLRRRVRQSLKRDSRVLDVLDVTVTPRAGAPGVVDIFARVRAIGGASLDVELTADLE
ncbi:MAG TPA: DUF2634 domain-containing protein [Myxococcota bacterium]|nr:DUF2634 domain-containing protein [Myxococcota bacterium]